MLNKVKSDIRRYIATEEVKSINDYIELFLFNYSLWILLSYRFGRWVRYEFKIPVIKQAFKILTKITHSILGLLTGIQIPFETSIGAGLYIGHTGMLILNSDCKIGSNCNLGPGVVIGQGGRGDKKGSPVVGNNVYIGVGAKILGKIKVGDFAAIGANAVVTKDVPPHSTVAGVPARVINQRGSEGFIR
jgi:serine O-acetyltransferase